MAGVYTIKHQTVFGDLNVVIYTVSNFTDAETVRVPGIRTIFHAVATTETQDIAVGLAIGTGSNSNVLTIDVSANTHDGTMIVVGK